MQLNSLLPWTVGATVDCGWVGTPRNNMLISGPPAGAVLLFRFWNVIVASSLFALARRHFRLM